MGKNPPEQLTLPDTRDGRSPVGMKTKIGGAGSRISRPHELGQRVIVVLETKVRATGHEDTNDGPLWVETLKTVDLFELEEGAGARLLSALRQSARSATGQDPLPGTDETIAEGIAGIVDASGVVLTDADLAELRGDPSKALTDDRFAPVVLVFSTGERGLWPDDWEGLGQSRAPIGGTMRRPQSTKAGDVAQVVELVDHVTGETLDKWTAEREEARLLTLEEELTDAEAVEEARADVAAAEELEAARTPVDQVDPPEADDPAPVDEAGPFDPPDEEVEFVEDADGFASPAPVDPDLLAAGDPEAIEHLPEPDDFAFVDRKLAELKPEVDALTDRARALRLLKAEEQGRGRGLQPRKGVLELLTKRAAALFSDLGTVEVPDVDADDLAGFGVPEDAELDDFGPGPEEV